MFTDLNVLANQRRQRSSGDRAGPVDPVYATAPANQGWPARPHGVPAGTDQRTPCQNVGGDRQADREAIDVLGSSFVDCDGEDRRHQEEPEDHR